MLIRNPILMYHSTEENGSLRVNIRPSLLRKHLQLLSDKGYEIVSIRELLADPSGRKVGLTFDDGYLNNLNIIPMLKEFSANATFFVLTGVSGESCEWHRPAAVPIMGEDGWKTIADAGFEVAAHGMTHADVSLLDPDRQEEEIVGSINRLKSVLQVPEVGYAYPSGFFDKSAVDLVKRHASYGCAVRYRGFREGRWTIRRINVAGSDSIGRLRAKFSMPFRLMCDLGY